MQTDKLSREIVRKCMSILKEELWGRVITNYMVINYEKAKAGNLHSVLQYALIKAGLQAGILAIPEYRIRLKPPLDPFEKCKLSKKKMHVYRADVGFLQDTDKPQLIGFGEAYTLDSAHSCCKPLEVEELKWVTSRVKIPYALKHGNFKPTSKPFVIIVTVLPTHAERTPSWKDQRKLLNNSKNYYEVFSPKWKELIQIVISKGCIGHLVIIKERGEIEYYSGKSN